MSFGAWIALLLVLDQLTKYAAREALVIGQSKVVIPHVLEFTLVYNTGVAFGLFENMGVFLTPVAIAVAIAAGWSYARASRADRLYRAAMVLVGAGATGNLVDRIANSGRVTDFINIHIIHVFNLADVCITLAVALLILHMFLDARRSKSNIDPPGSTTRASG